MIYTIYIVSQRKTLKKIAKKTIIIKEERRLPVKEWFNSLLLLSSAEPVFVGEFVEGR